MISRLGDQNYMVVNKMLAHLLRVAGITLRLSVAILHGYNLSWVSASTLLYFELPAHTKFEPPYPSRGSNPRMRPGLKQPLSFRQTKYNPASKLQLSNTDVSRAIQSANFPSWNPA